MTDEERTTIKADIIAELPKHLDDLYVSKKDMKAAVDAIDAALADLTIRVMDVQVTVALTHAHAGIDVTDHDWWGFVGGMRDVAAQRVRRRVGKWLSRIQNLEDRRNSVMVHRLIKLLGVDGAQTDADRDGG